MVQTVADIIIDMGKAGRGAPASVRWLADWLPDADRRTLDENDLARINAYAGDANQLQELLGTIAPLMRPVWFEAAVIAEHGTEMVLGCGAVPGPNGSLDIGFASYAPARQRMIGPFGPARVTTTGMARPTGVTDEAWRELRATAGIVIRALLLDEAGKLS